MLRMHTVPLKFLAVGIVNTLFGLLVIYSCKWLFGLGDTVSNVSGYMAGLAVSFLLNRSWTFQHFGPMLPAFARFMIVFGIAYSANLATVLFSIHQFGVNPYLAHAIGIAPYTILFYLGSRNFAFGRAQRDRLAPRTW